MAAPPAQEAINHAQLPIDFSAPALAAWYPPNAPAHFSLKQIVGLTRNASDVARSCLRLVGMNVNDLLPPPQCGTRLKTLLEYFYAVVGDFYQQKKPQSSDLKAIDPDSDNGRHVRFLKFYGKSLSRSLIQLSQIWGPEAPWVGVDVTHFEFGRDEPWADTPTEPMMELLGQLYIYVAEHPAQGAEPQQLNTADLVQAVLRDMVAPDRWRNRTRDRYTKPAWRKNGTVACIFATQHHPAGPILLGSTCAEFAWPMHKEPFRDARISRMGARPPQNVDFQDELTELFNDDPDWTDFSAKLQTMQQVAGGQPGAAVGAPLSHEFCDWMRQELNPFTPINHTNQIAMSHFVLPGTGVPENPWFSYVARCLKCRVIQLYNIVAEQALGGMDEPARLNKPLDCAEDIAHAKLRTLYPDEPVFADPHLPPPGP